MNLAAKLNWSIPQGIFLYHRKKKKKPMISIGNMQITNRNMIARIFLVILVFSSRRLFMSEDEQLFQKDSCEPNALNMSEYRTVMKVIGMAIKTTDTIIKWILSARKLSNAGSKLKEQIWTPFTF